MRQQISKIYQVPTILGFFGMILYANDGKISPSEGTGLLVCAALMAGMAAVIYGFYQRSLGVVCKMLGISRKAVK
ncbi:MAG TPA: hypothetical protein H9873_08700 [Candidatus Dorea gallistercoris]|uniref:Uncharacterized protein n=1 Tax=Candidatus Dorea gallistercoris TaxID=2838542 RepID=A0A9D1UE26_9FIRM|nr:hypothetical protein [Candidatus Dorea gallistercoris]